MSKTSKEEIIKAAAAVFMRYGYEGTSLSEIAKAVGVAKPALFFHFENKEDLYQKVVEKFIVNAQTPKQKFVDCKHLSLYNFIEYYVQKVENTMQFLHQIIQGQDKTALQYFTFTLECSMKYKECARAILDLNQEELELWESIIQNARQSGEIRSNVNAKALAEIFRYAFLGISFMFSRKKGVTVKEIQKILHNIYDTVKTIK